MRGNLDSKKEIFGHNQTEGYSQILSRSVTPQCFGLFTHDNQIGAVFCIQLQHLRRDPLAHGNTVKATQVMGAGSIAALGTFDHLIRTHTPAKAQAKQTERQPETA